MKYLLCYREDSLGEAWRARFADRPDVEIVGADICELSCDAIVSPANSFGFMDGGLDLRLSQHFGWDLEKHVQAAIQARPMHELLVGEALIVSTENARVPWLVVAPTMRVPMRVRTSINAYLAMKAILTSARNHVLMPPIRIVAIPGLGTGVGQMSPEICAEQMWQAFREVVLGEGHPPENFAEAQKRHVQLNRTGMLFD